MLRLGGTLGFITIELGGFAIAIAVYLCLAMIAPAWPPSVLPRDLLPGTILTTTGVATATSPTLPCTGIFVVLTWLPVYFAIYWIPRL